MNPAASVRLSTPLVKDRKCLSPTGRLGQCGFEYHQDRLTTSPQTQDMRCTTDRVDETRVASVLDSLRTSGYESPLNDCEPNTQGSLALQNRVRVACSCWLLARRRQLQRLRVSTSRR